MPRQDEVDVVTTVIEGVERLPRVRSRCDQQRPELGLHGAVDLLSHRQLRGEVGVVEDIDAIMDILALRMTEEPLLRGPIELIG